MLTTQWSCNQAAYNALNLKWNEPRSGNIAAEHEIADDGGQHKERYSQDDNVYDICSEHHSAAGSNYWSASDFKRLSIAHDFKVSKLEF